MSTTSTGEFSAEREMLGTRDRDELHEIASAMGVRGATRLRKADLIEAILDKATSGASVPEPTGEKPKKRATRRKASDGEAADTPDTADGGDRPAAGAPAGAERAERAEPEPAPAPPEAAPTRAVATGDVGGGQAEAAPGETQRLSFGGGESAGPAAGAA